MTAKNNLLKRGDQIQCMTANYSANIDAPDTKFYVTVESVEADGYRCAWPDGSMMRSVIPFSEDLVVRRRTEIMVALNVLGHLPRLVSKWRALAREKKMMAVNLYLSGTDARTAVNSARRAI
jgi:hypothetical protein